MNSTAVKTNTLFGVHPTYGLNIPLNKPKIPSFFMAPRTTLNVDSVDVYFRIFIVSIGWPKVNAHTFDSTAARADL